MRGHATCDMRGDPLVILHNYDFFIHFGAGKFNPRFARWLPGALSKELRPIGDLTGAGQIPSMFCHRKPANLFQYFHSSPKVIRIPGTIESQT